MVTETKSKIKYPGVPADVHTKPVEAVIFSGNPGSPFVAEIAEIERKAEEIRVSISRYLQLWNNTFDKANRAGDLHVELRANNETQGLYALLDRLSKATT